MATKLSTILTRIRRNIHEPVARYWSDAELLGHVNAGIKDLARALNTQYQLFFFDTNPNVTYVSESDRLSNVPQDCSTILGLELVDPTLYPALIFVYKDYNADEFISARAAASQSPATGGRIYFCAAGAGGPVSAPTIFLAPKLSANLSLRLTYIPSLADRTENDNNPVPGESDQALVNWGTAYARGKLKEDQAPDPEWLALYATEKTNILVAVSPRQEVTDQVAESPFGEG